MRHECDERRCLGQKGAVAAEIEPLYATEAAKRKVEAGKVHGRGQKVVADPRQAKEEPRERKASERAAKQVGTSGRAVQQFKRVQAQDAAVVTDHPERWSGVSSSVRGAEARPSRRMTWCIFERGVCGTRRQRRWSAWWWCPSWPIGGAEGGV